MSLAALAADDDPVALRMLLAKHREGLSVTLKEVNALKAIIKGLEGTIQQLQLEKISLTEQLRVSKETQADYLQQIQKLSSMCEQLTGAIQRTGVENAGRMSRAEQKWRAQEAKYQTQVERLTSQLLSTQHPQSAARPIPWSKIATIEGHPAHVLREVVLEDQKREERILNNALPTDALDHLDMLVSLGQSSSGKHSEDEAVWRQVLSRVHLVLRQRRKLLHVSVDDPAPVEFLLRTRHQMVTEVAHLHDEVRKCSNLLMGIIHKIEASTVFNGGAAAMEGQLELVCSFVGDMDFALNRVKTLCFSDVDKSLFDVPLKAPKTELGM